MSLYIGNTKIPRVATNLSTSEVTSLDTGDKMLLGVTAFSNGIKYTGTIPTLTDADAIVNRNSVTIKKGYYEKNYPISVNVVELNTPNLTLSTDGIVTATVTQLDGYVTTQTRSNTLALDVKTDSDVVVSGAVVTVPKGFYTTDLIKVVASVNLNTPNITFDDTTGTITATVTQDNSGYVLAGTKNNTLTLESNTSTDITVNENVVSIPKGFYLNDTTKTVVTEELSIPQISVDSSGLITSTVTQNSSGYVSAGNKQSTSQLNVREASTIIPGQEDITISSGIFLTGPQLIKGDSNLNGQNILLGTTIFGVPGEVVVQKYYTGSTVPSNTLGEEGDLYLRM